MSPREQTYFQLGQLSTSVLNWKEFSKLQEIGGHKVYHLEGDALEHSLRVAEYARECYGWDSCLFIAALLHDVGKIYTGIKHGENDWIYPNHCAVGAENLHNVLFINYHYYPAIKWFVKHHIKPLFWIERSEEELQKEFEEILRDAPDGFEEYCTLENLRTLALCDIAGSETEKPQTKIIKFLTHLF